MTPHPAALEAYNRATFDPQTPELELAPAETLQVEPDEERPIISPRFGFGLLVIVAFLAGAHVVWAANGMPTL